MSLLVSDIVQKVSESLRLKSKYASQILGRTTRSYGTNTQDVYSPDGQGQIRLQIPGGIGWCDMLSYRIQGVISWTQGLKLTKSINSVVQRMQILTASGEVLIDTDEMNYLSSIMSDFSMTPYEQESSFGISHLYGSDDYRTASFVGTRFSWSPFVSLFRTPDILPMHLLNGFQINIFLSDKRQAFIKLDNALTEYTYKISQVDQIIDVLTVSSELEAMYQKAYAENKLSWYLTRWVHAPFYTTAMKDQIKIDNLANSNRCLLAAPRLASRIFDPSVDSFQRNAQSLAFYQLTVGSDLKSRINCSNGGAEAYNKLQQSLDYSNHTSITPYNFHCHLSGNSALDATRSSKFAICETLELDTRDDTILSGLSKNPVYISLEYANQIQQTQWSCWVLQDVQLQAGVDIGTRVFA